MDILKKLSEMNKTNNNINIYGFTIHYSTSNIGVLPNFNESRYFDITNDDGIQGEYMTKEEAFDFLEMNKQLSYGREERE